jgi:hypothetical protein
MQLVKLSEATAARRRIFFTAVKAVDGDRLTGLTAFDLYITKNGGTVAACAGTVTEVNGSTMKGVYYYELTTGEIDTLGQIVFCVGPQFGDGEMEFREIVVHIVAFDPFDAVRLGLTALPNAVASAAGGLPTAGTGTNQISLAGGRAKADVVYWNAGAVAVPASVGYPLIDLDRWRGSTPNSLVGNNVPAHVNAVANDAITAAAIATDAIGSGELAAGAVTKIATQITTDHGSGSYLSGGTPPTAAAIAQAVWEYVIEGTSTTGHYFKRMAAVLFGKRNKTGTTHTYRNPQDTATRVTATVGPTGRTAVTYND